MFGRENTPIPKSYSIVVERVRDSSQLFHKEFCEIYFSSKEKMLYIIPNFFKKIDSFDSNNNLIILYRKLLCIKDFQYFHYLAL